MPSAPTSGFTIEDRQRLEDLELQVARLISDTQLGRALTGPVWMDGASIVNGTVSADKLIVNTLESITVNTGSLNVTGSIKAATSFPAVGARIEINSTGLKGYRNATDTTFVLSTDGSGSIGIGSTAMTWTSAGVVSIPKAAIGTLTIADVSGGVFGGTYQTSAGTTRMELSTAGMKAFNTGTEYFNLDAASGTLTLTGRFTVKSNSTGARVEILASGGIAGYYDSTNTSFVLNTDGTGRLGPATGSNSITWNSSGVSIGGVALSGGKITASHLSVSTLSAISLDLGTITAGNINAASVTVTNLNASNISNGSLGSGAAGIGLGGTNGLTVNGTLSIASGGKIKDADNSYWDQSGIVLRTTGSYGDSIKWQNSTGSVDYGSLYGDAGAFYMARSSGYTSGRVALYNGAAEIYAFSDDNGESGLYLAEHARLQARSGYEVRFTRWNNVLSGYFNGSGEFVARLIYPGNASSFQTSRYLSDNASGRLFAGLSDSAGASEFAVVNSGSVLVFGIASNGAVKFKTGNPGIETGFSTLGSLTGRVSAYNGSGSFVGYIPIYSNIT